MLNFYVMILWTTIRLWMPDQRGGESSKTWWEFRPTKECPGPHPHRHPPDAFSYFLGLFGFGRGFGVYFEVSFWDSKGLSYFIRGTGDRNFRRGEKDLLDLLHLNSLLNETSVTFCLASARKTTRTKSTSESYNTWFPRGCEPPPPRLS